MLQDNNNNNNYGSRLINSKSWGNIDAVAYACVNGPY